MQVAAEGSDLHCFLCRLFTAHSSTKMWGLFPLREPISSFFRAIFFPLFLTFLLCFCIFTFPTIRQFSLPFLLLLGSHLFSISIFLHILTLGHYIVLFHILSTYLTLSPTIDYNIGTYLNSLTADSSH